MASPVAFPSLNSPSSQLSRISALTTFCDRCVPLLAIAARSFRSASSNVTTYRFMHRPSYWMEDRQCIRVKTTYHV